MNPGWQVYMGIWRHAVFANRRQVVMAWTYIALAFFALSAMIMMFAKLSVPGDRSVFRVVGIAPAALGMFYWMRYVSGAVGQNTPANARLVPGLCASVRRTTIGAWFLTLLPMALLAASFEYPLPAFIGLSVMVTALGMSRGGRPFGTVVYILLTLIAAIGSDQTSLKTWLSSAPVAGVLGLLSVAFAWNALHSIFPAGGERHWKMLPEQDKQRASTDLHLAMQVARSSGRRAWVYPTLLKHDLRPGAAPRHLLLHALGPANHRLDFVMPLLVVTAVALLVRLVMPVLGLTDFQVPLGVIYSLAAPMLLMQGFVFHRMIVSMDSTRGEQALVRLAPRAPQTGRLGRSLARQILTICLVEWLVAGIAVLCLMLLFGAGRKELVLMASVMCTNLALTGWALRDYSGKGSAALMTVILQTLTMGGGFVALMLSSSEPLAWSALLVLMLAASIAIVHGRWKTMVEAPVPFPARRFI